MKMQIFEVVLSPSVLESQYEDVALVKASTIKGACLSGSFPHGPKFAYLAEPGRKSTL